MNRPQMMITLFALIGAFTASTACKDHGRDDVHRGEPASASAPDPKPGLTAAAMVERGRYLVTTGACHDCHTPLKMGPTGPVPDMTRALSGHPATLEMPPAPVLPAGPWVATISATNTAWSGPWGVSFTANITSDPKTGIGAWTLQNFIDTIRNGRHMGVGRPLLPPMPAAVYANMTDDDLGALFAYLKTVPAVDNKVPGPRAPIAAAIVPASADQLAIQR